jgi:hypothetical protein
MNDPLEVRTGLSAAERQARAKLAAACRWGRVTDRTAATRPAREAADARFYAGLGHLPGHEQERIAGHRRTEHALRMRRARQP